MHGHMSIRFQTIYTQWNLSLLFEDVMGYYDYTYVGSVIGEWRV